VVNSGERLTETSIRADSVEVAERLAQNPGYYEAQFKRSVEAFAELEMVPSGEVPSPAARGAVDLLQERQVERQYGVPGLDGRDLYPMLMMPRFEEFSAEMIEPPRMLFSSRQGARAALESTFKDRNLPPPGSVEGVNVFFVPHVAIDGSEGFGHEVVSEDSNWVILVHRPATIR